MSFPTKATPRETPLSLGPFSRTQEASKGHIAGVDEVGRGALFGPVEAAAVLLTDRAIPQLLQAGVRDSKVLTPKQRSQLCGVIRSLALDCQVGLASVEEIDRWNILQASLLAMKRAIHKLHPTPGRCIIDGQHLIPGLELPQQAIIKGDHNMIPIAAASIIAKVWRDQLIIRHDSIYPGYHLAQNKGYGSPAHRSAIVDLGPSPQHRSSFRPCQGQKSGSTSET